MDSIKLALTRRQFLTLLSAATGIKIPPAWTADLQSITPQPFFASVMRAVAALAEAGQPIAKPDADRLAMLVAKSDAEAVMAAEAILNRYTLAHVSFNGEGVGTAALGQANRELVGHGWRSFLIRVGNSAGSVKRLEALPGGITRRSNGEQSGWSG